MYSLVCWFLKSWKYLYFNSEFECLAIKVLDECNNIDPEKAALFIECKYPSWGNMDCLEIAALADNKVRDSFTHHSQLSLYYLVCESVQELFYKNKSKQNTKLPRTYNNTNYITKLFPSKCIMSPPYSVHWMNISFLWWLLTDQSTVNQPVCLWAEKILNFQFICSWEFG